MENEYKRCKTPNCTGTIKADKPYIFCYNCCMKQKEAKAQREQELGTRISEPIKPKEDYEYVSPVVEQLEEPLQVICVSDSNISDFQAKVNEINNKKKVKYTQFSTCSACADGRYSVIYSALLFYQP